MFQAVLGTPAVVCGPGNIAVAHKPDEYVSEAQMAQCDLHDGALWRAPLVLIRDRLARRSWALGRIDGRAGDRLPSAACSPSTDGAARGSDFRRPSRPAG